MANHEMSFGNVYSQNSWQNCFSLFDCNSCFLKLSPNYQLHAVLWTGCNSNSVTIMQWNKYTHRTLSSKTQQFPLIILKRSYLVLNNEKRKQGNKKEKLKESLHLTVKPRRLNDRMTLVSETWHEQIVTSHTITFRTLAVQTLNGTTSERATNG